MIAQAAVAMLACADIGAVHSVLFGGFSPEALANRIEGAASRLVITSDYSRRGGKVVPLKANVDAALADPAAARYCKKVVVVKRTGDELAWHDHRDLWYHEITAKASIACPAAELNAEDPLFILYTSGSTGKPKGLEHTTGGYLVYASMTHEYVFDYREGDIYWCTADIGWVTGHSYIVYGPLDNGATTLMFEGVPSYPDNSRFGRVIEKHRVNQFYTAPTAIRALMQQGAEVLGDADLSSLRLLGSVGEPINPEAWEWYHRVVGQGRCGGVTVARFLDQALQADHFEVAGHPGVEPRRRHRLLRSHQVERLERGRAFEGRPPRQALVEDRPQRVHVHRRADGAGPGGGLLGGHVARRAQDGARARLAGVGVLDGLGQAEVGDLGHAVGRQEDVGRLQVAVDDPAFVRRLERFRDLNADGDRLVQRDRPARDPIRQVLPADQFHRQEVDRFHTVQAMDHRDVGVIQRSQESGLSVEAGQALGVVRQRIGKDLERHRPVESCIGGSPDLAHPAGADSLLEGRSRARTAASRRPETPTSSAGLERQTEVQRSTRRRATPPVTAAAQDSTVT